MKFQDCHYTALNTLTSILQANLTTTVSYANTTFTETAMSTNEMKFTTFNNPSDIKTGKLEVFENLFILG